MRPRACVCVLRNRYATQKCVEVGSRKLYSKHTQSINKTLKIVLLNTRPALCKDMFMLRPCMSGALGRKDTPVTTRQTIFFFFFFLKGIGGGGGREKKKKKKKRTRG